MLMLILTFDCLDGHGWGDENRSESDRHGANYLNMTDEMLQYVSLPLSLPYLSVVGYLFPEMSPREGTLR